MIGKLFTGSQKASASISAENGAFVASKGTGSTGALASQASGLAGTVATGLQQIAQQLGGGVGSISGLSIGTKNGKVHVNAVGGQIGKKGSGDIGFGKDGAEEAVAYAIQQAILKGAVTGLSSAVQQAIKSSTDINKALAEALKVQDLELLIGGVNAQIDKAFRDFETQAKERVRLATTYGFDVVAIEKRNGEDRVKLAQQLATQQVGSLTNTPNITGLRSLHSALPPIQPNAGAPALHPQEIMRQAREMLATCARYGLPIDLPSAISSVMEEATSAALHSAANPNDAAAVAQRARDLQGVFQKLGLPLDFGAAVQKVMDGEVSR